MNRLDARLTRLETRQEAAAPPLRYFVVDYDEPLPPDLRVTDLVLRLSRNAASVEDWLEQVRAMGFGPGAQKRGV
jgi:hypothetical protein